MTIDVNEFFAEHAKRQEAAQTSQGADTPTPTPEVASRAAEQPVEGTNGHWQALHQAVDNYIQQGMRCLLLGHQSKAPLAGWSSTLATTDAARLHEDLNRLERDGHPHPNIGICAGSGLLFADVDTPAEREAFIALVGTPPAYTVTTPGMVKDGKRVHSEGGHIYYQIDPADSEVQAAIARLGQKVDAKGFQLVLGSHQYVVAPPSYRAEGAYTIVGSPQPLPEQIRQLLLDKIAEKSIKTPAVVVPTTDNHDPIDEWADSVTWDEVVGDTGVWTPLDDVDTCGCPLWHYEGAAHEKSAVAHEGDCSHAPYLHLYSDTARGEYGKENLTKIQVYAHHRGLSIGEACEELGIAKPAPVGAFGSIEPLSIGTAVSTTSTSAPVVEESTEQIFNRRVAEGIVEIEASLGLELTTEQQSEFAQTVWADEERGEQDPCWEMLPGIERQRLHGVDAPLMTAAECAQIFNLNDYTRRVWWYMAEGERIGNPLIVLLKQLQRVARRVPVTVSASPYGHQPLSTFVALVGDSAGGKSAANDDDLWPLMYNASGTIATRDMEEERDQPEATPQGLWKAFYREVEDDEGNEVLEERTPPVVHMYLDELAQDLGVGKSAKGHSAGMFEALSSAWSGKNFARSVASTERTAPERYTLTILGNLTPGRAGDLLDTAGQGFMQRWIFLSSDCPYVGLLDTRSISNPGNILAPRVPTFNGIEAFTWCEEMHQEYRRAMRNTRKRKRSEGVIKRAHSFPTKFRLACAMAAMSGSTEVTSEMWHWAQTVYHVSSRTLTWVEREVSMKASEENRARGRARGETNRAARVGEQMAITNDAQTVLEIVAEKGAEGAMWKDIKARFSRGRHDEVKALLGDLERQGHLRHETRLGGNHRPVDVYFLPVTQ